MARLNRGFVNWLRGLPGQMGYVVAGMALCAGLTGVLVWAGVLETPKPTPPNMQASLRATAKEYLRGPRTGPDSIPNLPSIYATPGELVAFYVDVTNRGESPATDTVVSMRQVSSPNLVLESVGCWAKGPKGPHLEPCKIDLIHGGARWEEFREGTIQYVVVGRVMKSTKPGTLLTAQVSVDSTNAPDSSDTAYVTVREPGQ
jgi:hypothetical protein